ncbi:Hypothetical protein FKW44_006276 [Caligus rogercresseyi]|uniref:Uncharacterized protein n=1 Tax=Caligus rogercresseyi TaxID=217165 RepID=A0A7T8KD42_CALRO|nr:Hypothetical protein FKW44_006276 [Caligus rogercresseyi]
MTSTPATTTCGASLRGTLQACSQHCGLLESCHHPGSGQLVRDSGHAVGRFSTVWRLLL